jgi:Transcriptional regulator
MSNNASLNDPRITRTRALLRQALMELVTQKSFSSLTIQEVTKQAGLNRSTFYLHYVGLHELLEDCGKDLFGQMRAMIYNNVKSTNSAKTSDLDEYEPFVECVFLHLQQHLSFYRAMLGRQGDPYFGNLFRELLAELIFEPIRGDKRGDAESELVMRFFTTGFSGIATWWLESDQRISIKEAAHLVTLDVLPAYMKMVQD